MAQQWQRVMPCQPPGGTDVAQHTNPAGGFSGGALAFETGALGSDGRRDFNEEEAIP